MPWLFFLFKQELGKFWQAGHLFLPRRAQTTPTLPKEHMSCVEDSVQNLASMTFHHRLKITSANVLTLLPGSQVEAGFLDSARQETILKQAEEANVHIFSLQETRLRKTTFRTTPAFWIFQAAAEKGHGGVALCFNRMIPYGQKEDKNYFFQKEHFSVIYANHRVLLVKVEGPGLKILVLSVHAPQSGQSDDIIRNWWMQLSTHIPLKYKGWPIFAAGVGDDRNLGTGGLQGETPNLNGQLMQEWLTSEEMWAPSTWSSCQIGPPGTWQHPGTGVWSRLDYICVPLRVHCEAAWVDLGIDVALRRNDHLAVSATIEFSVADHSKQTRVWRLRPQADSTVLRDHLAHLAPLHFTFNPAMDVHTHAWQLVDAINSHCSLRASAAVKPRKKAMSEETWELVKEKTHFRNEMLWWQRQSNYEALRAFFTLWAGRSIDERSLEEKVALCSRFVAESWFYFRRLGRLVTEAVRKDTKKFLEEMAARKGELDDGRFTKQLWQELRRHFPAMRKRREGFAPFQIECLDDQWISHFSSLEAGYVVEPEEHLDQCDSRQKLALASRIPISSIDELPSIVEVEKVLRGTQPGKAPGPDNLLPGYLHWASPQLASAVHMLYCQVYIQAAEPYPFKGGTMVPIWKKQSPYVANNYRGVVLLPTLAKALQALLRKRLVGALMEERPPGLMGGFPKQRVTFGSHSTKSFTALAATHQISTAILYIDLRHAYHHLIRGLSLGCHEDDADFVASLNALEEEGCREGCRKSLRAGCPFEEAFAGTPILDLLREIHYDTFFTIQGTRVRTARGSRPGSPLADMMFAGLTAKLHRYFDHILQSDVEVQRASAAMNTPAVTVTWADDITLELATVQAEALIPTLQRIAAQAFDFIRDHGLTLNLTPGKTSAVVAFRGAGAPQLRKNFLLGQKECEVQLRDEVVQLPLLCTYPHLGVKATASRTLEREILSRIGMTRSAFLSIKKQVIGNRHLSKRTRCRLVDSLLLSKLFFSDGAWDLLPRRLQRKLDGFVASLFREALDEQFWRDEKMSDERLFGQHLLLPPRMRIARDRLNYAASLVSEGPEYLWSRLLTLHARSPTTDWIAGLQSDLEWLHTMLPETRDAPWNESWGTRTAFWKASSRDWAKLVQRACKTHILQEHTISHVRWWHDLMYYELERHGASFKGLSVVNPGTTSYECHCGMSFESKRGLCVHQRHKHQRHAPEYFVATGSVCPVCLKDFWSTVRLRQHLAYAPRDGSCNTCYQQLVEAGHRVQKPEVIKADAAFGGINRLDAVQLPGPQPGPQTLQDAHRRQLEGQLQEVEEKLHAAGLPQQHDPEIWAAVHRQLTRVTMAWMRVGLRREPMAVRKIFIKLGFPP